MTRTENIIQWICRAVIAILLALPVYLGVRHGLLNLERNSVLESALAGAFLIHMRARPKAAEWLSALALGSVFTVAYAWLHHGYGNNLGAAPLAYATFLGLGSLIVLVSQVFAGARALRRLHRDTLFAAAAFPYFSFPLAFYLHWTTALQPRVFDLSLYAFDEALQFNPSLLFGNLMATSSALTAAAAFAYQSLPLTICFLVAAERESAGRLLARVLPLFAALGIAGIVLGNLLPAVGPASAFGMSFPRSLPSLSSLVIQPILQGNAPRNAMPSVHFACALLIWWNAAGLGRTWRWLAAGFVAITFVATMGFGEDYFVDLVVAVPLAVTVQSFALRTRSWAPFERRVAFWGGAGLTFGWIVALRAGLFLNAPAACWFAVVATCALALWWKRGLDRGHVCLEQKVLAVRPAVLIPER